MGFLLSVSSFTGRSMVAEASHTTSPFLVLQMCADISSICTKSFAFFCFSGAAGHSPVAGVTMSGIQVMRGRKARPSQA